ncbi:MAG: hypothetical protein ABSH20_08620 [Tepidisphaeraceae bacterium]
MKQLLSPAAGNSAISSAAIERYLAGNGGRLGGSDTRQPNNAIVEYLEAHGADPTSIRGVGRSGEEWIPGPGGSTLGGTFVDIKAVINGTTIRVQTVSS